MSKADDPGTPANQQPESSYCVGGQTMTTAEERLQILKMIEEGKISPEEGAKLLSALGKKPAPPPRAPGGADARWFRVRVTDAETGKSKVNVNIPMGLVNVGMKMGARFVPETSDIDLEELFEQIKSGAHGKIVEVIDDESGEHVEIFIE
jgi:hypothetical protein